MVRMIGAYDKNCLPHTQQKDELHSPEQSKVKKRKQCNSTKRALRFWCELAHLTKGRLGESTFLFLRTAKR